MAWYVLAVAREKAGDFTHSLKAYESALALLPDQSEVANDLGRLAFRMGMKDVAEQLFRRYLEAHPDAYSTVNNLACAVRDQGRAAEAIEILQRRDQGAPGRPACCGTRWARWSPSRATTPTAIIFFDEALRLDPDFAKARYNRGNARLELGDAEAALADCEAAHQPSRRAEDDRLMMRLARSTIKIGLGPHRRGLGRLRGAAGPAVRRRHRVPGRPAPRWTPETPICAARRCW